MPVPKIRIKQSPITNLMRQIEESAPEYARRATELSDAINALESFLDSLDGKFVVSVETESQKELALEFRRRKSTWSLEVSETTFISQDEELCYTDWRPLRDAPLELKIEASNLFEPLLNMFRTVLQERLEKLRKVAPSVAKLRTRIKSTRASEEGEHESPF